MCVNRAFPIVHAARGDLDTTWACSHDCGQYDMHSYTDLLFTSMSELSGEDASYVAKCVRESEDGQFLRCSFHYDLCLARLVGLLLPVLLLDTVGRRKTMFTMFALLAVFCIPLMFCLGR